MDTLQDTLLNDDLTRRGLFVVVTRQAGGVMLELAARLALRGALRVLDGGNRFNVYRVARAVGRMSRASLRPALERICVARAFTCYQMAAMLEQTLPETIPTLVVDLLGTFYDESVPFNERRRLLGGSVHQLQHLGKQAPVVVSLRPPRSPQPAAAQLQETVQRAADLIWIHAEPPPATAQLSLF